MAKTKRRRARETTRIRRAKPSRKVTARKAARRPARRANVPKRGRAKVASKRPAPKRAVRARKPVAGLAPLRAPAAPSTLARERRRLSDAERLESNRMDAQLASSVRAGRNELRHRLAEHTESDPSLTAGDVDAKWDDAYAVGDEAPGGDNPTPDQDRVDEIGHALGIEYQDAEELKGSDKITKRDHHRWELDPASSEDWPHDEEG